VNGSDPMAVITGFMAALNAGDVEAVVAAFADDCAVTSPDGDVLRGREQIRDWAESLIARHADFGPGPTRVGGDTATWTAQVVNDYSRQQGIAPLEVVLEAVVRDRLLTSFAGSYTPAAAAKVQALREKSAQ
jgi:ketosteroid isomerase-like protein